MSKVKSFECAECGALFQISHDLEITYYKPKFCAFCGEELDSDNMASFDDIDTEEDE